MTRLQEILGLKFPLIVAPMAGGPSSPDLVCAASESGALGSIGAAYSSPSEIHGFVNNLSLKTQKPFAINLFVPHESPNLSPDQIRDAIAATQIFREELSLPQPVLTPPFEEDFDAQFETVLSLKPRVLSFVFGTLKEQYIGAAHDQGLILIGTATTPEEALELKDSGVDAIVLQGVEAGGHRGIFNPNAPDPGIPLSALLRETKKKVKVPLIAAGGIMTSHDIHVALQLGADAVQMGTAFMATKEAGTPAPFREKLLDSPQRQTKLTRAFSGRLARGIPNRFMRELDSHPHAILPFPAQNIFTRDIRSASQRAGWPDHLSLWCGTGAGDLWTGSARDLIAQLFC